MVKARALALNLALALAALILALAATEVLLRALPRGRTEKSEKSYLVDNMEFSYRYSLNSRGYRGPEFPASRKQDELRVILIGDSFVEGTGLADDERIGAVLERALRNDSSIGREVQVLSAGKPGVATDAYVRIAEEMEAFHSDALVVLFYVDNDITTGRSPLGRSIWGLRIASLLGQAASDIRSKYVPHCSLPGSIYPYVARVTDPRYRENFCKSRINAWLLQRGAYGEAFGGENGYYRRLAKVFESTTKTKANLLRLKTIARGRPFLILLVPSAHQVSTHYFAELRKIGFVYERDNEPVNSSPQEAIRAFLSANQIAYVDLLGTLRAREAEGRARHYYPIDLHFNADGAKVAADAIADWLVRAPISPSKQPRTHR